MNDTAKETENFHGEDGRRSVMKRMCVVLNLAWNHVDPNGRTACDCFCEDSRISPKHFRNDGGAIAFVEDAVKEKIARDKSPKGGPVAVAAAILRRFNAGHAGVVHSDQELHLVRAVLADAYLRENGGIGEIESMKESIAAAHRRLDSGGIYE